jgi:site-specific recombinase XerD
LRRPAKVLRFAIDDTDLVFAHYDGSPLSPGTVSHTSKKIVKRAGLESRLQDNRHAFATLMMSFGVNPKVVSEMLGHSTIATTMDIYSHVPLGLQREVCACGTWNRLNVGKSQEKRPLELSKGLIHA